MGLQDQINAAPSGGIIRHPIGTQFNEKITINKSLTLEGVEVISPDADPAIFIAPGARGVTLNDVKASSSHSQIYDIVRIGMWEVKAVADLPADITLNRCEVFGQPGQEVQRGIAANGVNISIFDSKVREIHGRNAEAQAIAAWNTPGPFKILDCYIEASHIGLLFGGAEALIFGVTPSNIDLRRITFFRPLVWRGIWPCKNHLEFKNATDVVADGCVLENSWVSAQIGYAVLATVRNENGKNPWAKVQRIKLSNFHIKNCAGGMQLQGKDNNTAGIAGAGSDLTITNSLFEIATDMGTNGKLFQPQDFNGLKIDRIEGNAPHSYLNPSGDPMSGLSLTNSLLAQGAWGFFGDGDRSLTSYAPDGVVRGNVIYGPVVGRPMLAGNQYVATKPNPIPTGVGVDMAALLAAQQKPSTSSPAPQPSPTPIPITSPDGTKAVTITDDKGGVWTIGPRTETLRNGLQMGGGAGTMYKWFAGNVYVLGEGKWWKWNGDSWTLFGVTEPGLVPIPVPTPTPDPPVALRAVTWPSSKPKQNEILTTQWAQRYRLKRHLDGGMVEFEKVP